MTNEKVVTKELMKIVDKVWNNGQSCGGLSPYNPKQANNVKNQAHDQIIELFREDDYEQLLSRYYNASCSGCPEGHASFWKTIRESDEWKLWTNSNPHYDIPECEELGIMSKQHWEDFVKFITEAEKKIGGEL